MDAKEKNEGEDNYGGVMEVEAEEEGGSNSNHGKAMERPVRSQFRWTKEMHHYFVHTVDKLGGPERATPKIILQMMNVKHLNLGQLKYHLQMYRGKKLDEDGKALSSTSRHLRGKNSHIFYPRTGSDSLYGFHNRGLLGAKSFLEHDRVFQHPISHQLNYPFGNLWHRDMASNQYPVSNPVWRNQEPAYGLFNDIFSKNDVMPPQPPLQPSNVYNVRDATMGNGIVTHHQFLTENRSPPSETIENQRKDKVIWSNSEWIGSSSTPPLQPNLINFIEPSWWNNNEQFPPSSNDLNIRNNTPEPQLEPQELKMKNKDKWNLDLSLSLDLGYGNHEKLDEYAKEINGQLSLSLCPPPMKPQPQPSEQTDETTDSERTVTDIQLVETNISDDATRELIGASDPTSLISEVE